MTVHIANKIAHAIGVKSLLHLELLQLVSSDLTLNQMLTSKSDERRKIFKALILRIHPDKHPNDTRATKLFQNVQNFYKDCSDLLQSSSSLTRLPSPSTKDGSANRSKSKGTNVKRSSMSSSSEGSPLSGSRSPSSPVSPSFVIMLSSMIFMIIIN